ncbi:nuclear transport factor 2 family protein [Streptomyces bobili]|uniref:nuclear transport factor 2 family protein n=1 Tax=Streptomyces TaxID=1883 RepID=UPI002254BCFE|nr:MULTISPECIES: nuclear transport factor 2 family protein [Streptomyces]MCX5528036.1 nuclear transport factor 2 family protein [Streptomyces bobili]MDX3571061.1 nuclear transport factor 2 family protein [Streptomyces sp. ID05-47C]
MNPSTDVNTRMEVIDAYRAHLRAMADGDTAALDALLDDGFTLTQTTGDRQQKAEWLADLRAATFVPLGIEEKTVTVVVDGGTARLVGRVITRATGDDAPEDQRLQLTMDYARVRDSWIALRSVARSW